MSEFGADRFARNLKPAKLHRRVADFATYHRENRASAFAKNFAAAVS